MSTPRHLRVAQMVKRELSDVIMNGLKDERIGGIISIIDVECTADCRRAKVFISIFGNDSQKQGTIDALNDHLGMIRGEICRRLKLRFAPELVFKLDSSLERGAKVHDLINKIARGEV